MRGARVAIYVLGSVAVAGFGASPSRCAEVVATPYTAIDLPIQLDRGAEHLEARVYRPEGRGPFPLVIINHGHPTDDDARKGWRLDFGKAARWFAARGFLVLVALRPGFGGSSGGYAEGAGPCNRLDYVAGGRRTAAVEAAIVRAGAGLADVDARRIVVVGVSAGGFGAIALADDPPPGVIGVVSVAGGRGSDGHGRICSGTEALSQAAAQFGGANRLPQLWLYADNDRYFPPDVAKALHTAYSSRSAATVELAMLPAFGEDGHDAFARGAPSAWAGPVDRFLQSVVPPR